MSGSVRIFDDRACALGEGAFWHPARQQLFWFDILAGRLLSRSGDRALAWDLGECVSAAGWIDERRLLIAGETSLSEFDIETGERNRLADLENDAPETRSNDGRADPFGGFWIGTMGKKAQTGRGAIYRFFDGRVETLFTGLTIPNAICFSVDGQTAFFADTAASLLSKVALDGAGWPAGEPQIFLDLAAEGLSPDGAVIDADGFFWNAQWGAARLARYGPDGALDRIVSLPAVNISCPAFGGPDLSTLYATSARAELADPSPSDGLVFAVETGIRGRSEPQVRLRDDVRSDIPQSA